jgi:hypothetical protein
MGADVGENMIMKLTASMLMLIVVLSSLIVVPQLVPAARANWLGPLPDPTPHLSVQTPKNGSRYFQDQVSLLLTTTVALGSDVTITYQLDHQATLEAGRSNDAGTEYSALLTSLSDGWHTLKIVAYGENWETAGSDTASITFLVDAVPPSVTLLSPRNETYTTTQVSLSFTLSEKTDWVGYSLDEKPSITIAGNTTLTGLSYGLHSVTVYANDTIGREGNSETIYFSIEQRIEETVAEQSEPFPSALVATASAILVVAAGLGLLAHFNKRKHEAESP